MNATAFMRMEKLKGAGIILVAARHNRREIAAELGAAGNIDPARSLLNVRLVGPDSAQGVANLARELMRTAGIDKPRKDAVLAIEFMFSLPGHLSFDSIGYFRDCMAWVAARFGGETNILSADVHFDEAQPHCHVLLLPMCDGTLQGSDMYGGPRKLEDHQMSFHEAVAARYGLCRARPKPSAAERQKLALTVLHRVRESQDPVRRSAVWPAVREAIERDPLPFAMILGLEPEAAPARSFVDIMTSTGKGAKTHADAERRDAALAAQHSQEHRNPIGFAASDVERTLSCVGFGPETVDQPASDPAAPPAVHAKQRMVVSARSGSTPTPQVESQQVPAQATRMPDGVIPAQTLPPLPSSTHREAVTGTPCGMVEQSQVPAETTGLEGVSQAIRGRVSVSDAVRTAGSLRGPATASQASTATQTRMQPRQAAAALPNGHVRPVLPQYSRERESEQPSANFCGETGEYRLPPVVERRSRREAELVVAEMLARRGLQRP